MELFVSRLLEAELAKVEIVTLGTSIPDILDWFLLALAAFNSMKNIIVFLVLLASFFLLLLPLQWRVHLLIVLILQGLQLFLDLLYFLVIFLDWLRFDLFWDYSDCLVKWCTFRFSFSDVDLWFFVITLQIDGNILLRLQNNLIVFLIQIVKTIVIEMGEGFADESMQRFKSESVLALE